MDERAEVDPITVREACPDDAGGMARVHVESWRTTYRGIVPDGYLAALSYERREEVWRRNLHSGWAYVAENEAGEIVGFADGGPERTGNPVYRGELYAIYLLESHQRRGTGRRLVQAVARRLRLEGMHAMLLWVLADNPACRFYQALGGQRLRTQQVEIGGATLDEVAYGWLDTRKLIEIHDPYT